MSTHRIPVRSVLTILAPAAGLVLLFVHPASSAEKSKPPRVSGQGRDRDGAQLVPNKDELTRLMRAGEPFVEKQRALERLFLVVEEIEAGALDVFDQEDAIDDLEDAIEELEGSLHPDYWQGEDDEIDAAHLDPDDGDEVFERGRECVHEIFEAIDDGDIENSALRDELFEIVDDLVSTDRRLAARAIADAQASAGDEDDIEEALDEQDDGDRRVAAAGKESDLDDKCRLLCRAIENEYCGAWEEAVEAVD